MRARLELASAYLLLGRDALPLVFFLLSHGPILCRAARLPLAEHVESEGTKDRAKLSFFAVRVLIHNHIDLENLAHGVPEIGRLVEPSVVEQIEYL